MTRAGGAARVPAGPGTQPSAEESPRARRQGPATGGPDLRLFLPAAAAWAGGLVGVATPRWVLPVLGVAVLCVAVPVANGLRRRGSPGSATRLCRRRLPGRLLGTAGAAVLVFGVVAVGGWARVLAHESGPVATLASDGAVVDAEVRLTGDARLRAGQYSDYVLVRATVRRVTGRGETHDVRAPVLVIADPDWQHVRLGQRLRVSGRLDTPQGPELAAVLLARGPPRLRAQPAPWWDGAEAVRNAVRDAVAHRPEAQRALVPALVDGEDSGVGEQLASDFRATGLTHLLAVSGTNLTLVVGALLVLARWIGVRGRLLAVVGAVGIVGFVLLARTEPSVVRAAAMGSVALLGMGSNGRQRGTRGLGAAVTGLLLVDPWLAWSVGFALSTLATAGILLLGPGWRDALACWMPRWCAEAVAVPATAQLAVTPVIAAISGQVSLVAVAANLLVAPVVAPATVLGLLGGLVGLLLPPAATLLGTLAGWSVGWIVLVARLGADLPGAAVGWGEHPAGVALLAVLCLVLALAAPRLLRRRASGVACCLVVAGVVLVPVPSPGWPGQNWVFAACDVGQGDGLVLRAGPGAGVVVDTGPDPDAMDACLDRLGVDRVPLLVLSHFHADHVGGLPGVLRGRRVGEVLVTGTRVPAEQAAQVRRRLAAAGLRARVPAYGRTRQVGQVTWQVLGPVPGNRSTGEGGTRANDASLVLLARVRGVSILLTGDVELDAQQALARTLVPGLPGVDVLKVPHHGSDTQRQDWLRSLAPQLAVISVGEDNDYGHPSGRTLENLRAAGARIARTDRAGDVVVTTEDGEPGLRTSD